MKLFRVGRKTLIRLTVIGLIVFGVVWWLIPDYGGDLDDFDAVVKICDRHGDSLRRVMDESEIVCEPVPLEESGKWTAKALVAFEDKRFYRHGGVDSIAICRAVLHNVVNARVVSGASTLTTLVVKLTEPRKRNLWTKLVEAHHARQLESLLTKDEILEHYLNRAPFGGNVHGIEAASRRYFGKPARNLSLAESALLAGLPQSPSYLRPDRYAALAVQQRNVVLGRMLENEMITPEEYAAALNQPMTIRRQALPFYAPHFCDFVWQRYPDYPGLKTTLDLPIQQMAERALQHRVNELAEYGVHGGAVVVLEVRTGALLTMVGSPDFWMVSAAGQVNGAVARRSPGSTLKPFAFAAAMDQGMYTPATMVADVPMHFAGYTPQNYSLEYCGPVSVRRALVQSLNIPALKCVERVGLDAFVGKLGELGLSTINQPAEHYGLGIAVGSCETSLLDLANAYACLARGGTWFPPHFLQEESLGETQRIFSEESAYMVADILGGDERSGELVGHMADVVLPRIAWKTGTSTGHRDAWAVGYNPEYVIGVWLGNPDGTGVEQLVGGSAAGPVVGEIFRQLYPEGSSPWFDRPKGIKTRSVCTLSGSVPSPECDTVVSDHYIPRISSVQPCGVHRAGEEVWPAEVQAFLERRGRTEAGAVQQKKGLVINSPVDGENFHLLSSSPGLRQEIRFEASGTHVPELYWFVDNELFRTAPSGQPVFWALEKGTHVVACADNGGNSVRVNIVVE